MALGVPHEDWFPGETSEERRMHRVLFMIGVHKDGEQDHFSISNMKKKVLKCMHCNAPCSLARTSGGLSIRNALTHIARCNRGNTSCGKYDDDQCLHCGELWTALGLAESLAGCRMHQKHCPTEEVWQQQLKWIKDYLAIVPEAFEKVQRGEFGLSRYGHTLKQLKEWNSKLEPPLPQTTLQQLAGPLKKETALRKWLGMTKNKLGNKNGLTGRRKADLKGVGYSHANFSYENTK